MVKKTVATIFSENGPKALLFFHAYTGSPNDFSYLLYQLEASGYTVYAPLLKGHGTSDLRNTLHVNPIEWLAEARAALNFLKQRGYTDIAVFGLSFGGVLSTILLAEDPKLIGGGSFATPFLVKENKMSEKLLYLLRQMVQLDEVAERSWQLKIEQQLAEIAHLQTLAYQKLCEINQPYFFAQAGCDELFDATASFKVIEQLQQTSFTFQWYAKSRHVLTTSLERRKFEKDGQTFINSLPWKMEEEHERNIKK